jgi:glucosamine--fructose-6-phosphate aminotransferase (isomerizing)
VYKTKGKVSELEQYAEQKDVSGTIGIAHTRWATHGEPTQHNAHPHYSQSEELAIIHNGIIENYSVLKEGLISEGFTFQSETDTEVLIQLIEFMKKSNGSDLSTAVQLALNQVVGAYAIAVLDRNNPDLIVAARKGSPLVIGIGEDEYFIGSDATPIIEYTDRVTYIGDEEIVTIQRDAPLKIRTIGNIEKTPRFQKLELTLSQLEKGGYPHFMLKEIFEQPHTLSDCMRGRVNVDANNITLAGFIDNREKFLNARRIIITACGTSWHAAQIGMYAIEEYARIPVEVEYSSEFRYRKPVIHKDDIVIAISQSGETADTLAAVELARKEGAFIFGICNVASTKAFTAQVTVLTMLAVLIGKEKGTISREEYLNLIRELSLIPEKVGKILKKNELIAQYAKTFTYASNCIYLGRGYNFPVALEGALKLKEISYIHAEGYPAAEMKHGPIALISHEMPVIVIATQSDTYDKVTSNIQEIKARKGRIISVVTEGDQVVSALSDFSVEVPETLPCLTPLLSVIPLQLLAYHIAVVKGCDVDQPRNLAKSVTVE